MSDQLRLLHRRIDLSLHPTSGPNITGDIIAQAGI